ncbi:MAG: alpha/beta hydrolase [Alphaproteobacteria bacterium]|nr:alpha/beta hydrolase [Alphaproteobacteria bacterium]
MQDVILVPGHLCDARLWAAQTEALRGTHRVSIGDTVQDDSMAGMARRILNAAPPEFALAGLSMGGHVCMEIMRQAPERVSRLALLDTGARADSPERAAERRRMIAQFEAGAVTRLVDDFLKTLFWSERYDDAALVETVRTMMTEVAGRAFSNQVRALAARPDSRPDMPLYRVSTLVLCGAEDRLTVPALSAEIAALIPNASLLEIPDCGHMSTMERPNAVNDALLAWLTA